MQSTKKNNQKQMANGLQGEQLLFHQLVLANDVSNLKLEFWNNTDRSLWNSRNQYKQGALDACILRQNHDMLNYLLMHPLVDIQSQMDGGYTLLHVAALSQNERMIHKILTVIDPTKMNDLSIDGKHACDLIPDTHGNLKELIKTATHNHSLSFALLQRFDYYFPKKSIAIYGQ